MIVGGIDIGSLSAKAALLTEESMIGYRVILAGPDSAETASAVMSELLDQENLRLSDLDYVVATGYGRINVPFAHKMVTEISCHARGTNWLFPSVRTILDIGGQDCKAIRCGASGRVESFVMNDKCAAGTGRYLERIAAALELPLDSIGDLSLRLVEGPENISSFCAVFAEADVIRAVRQGKHINDILAGSCEAIVKRVGSLLNRVGVEPEFSISGGVAKNIGVVRRLEQRLGLKVMTAPNPQIVGAIGAALFALDRAGQQLMAKDEVGKAGRRN